MTENIYDVIPYKGYAHDQTHPDRLSALARLFGMNPCDIQKSRILELGCGDGGNLIPMAIELPESRFLGIDLSAVAVSKGNDMIRRMGLKNIELVQMDIMDFPNSQHSKDMFDYIIAHGVFSWVPETVQDKLLAICKQNLAAHGVAFISYMAYPGAYLRKIADDIMRFHAQHFPETDQKILQARSFLKFITESVPSAAKAHKQVLSEELKTVSEIMPDLTYNYIIHDRLASYNQPMYFAEFISRMKPYGLKYLAEADFFEMQDFYLSEDSRNMLQKVAGHDIIIKEQFLDFIKGRKFRQTLICHADISLNRRLHPDMMKDFYFSCPAKPVDEDRNILKKNIAELIKMENLKFSRHGGSALTTAHPTPRAALIHLSDIWPAVMSFQELMDIARKYDQSKDGAAALSDILLSAFGANMVMLHTYIPRFSRIPGDRPVASPLAREQIRTGSRVTNLCHQVVELENTYGAALLTLMDGSLDIEALRKEALAIIRQNNISLNKKCASEKTDAELASEIDAELQHCAKYALIKMEK